MSTRRVLACSWDKGGEKGYWIFDFVKEFCFSRCLLKADIITEISLNNSNFYKTKYQNKFSNRMMYIIYLIYSFVASNYLTTSYYFPCFSICIFFLSFIDPSYLRHIYSSLFILFMHLFSMAATFSTSQILSSSVFFFIWSCSETYVSILTHILKTQPPHV